MSATIDADIDELKEEIQRRERELEDLRAELNRLEIFRKCGS